MAINKVVYGNQTLIDLTNSTLDSDDQLLSGTTAYDRSGTLRTGSATIPTYIGGNGIDITNYVVTNEAPIWHGDDVGTFVSPINADQLEGYSLLNLLKLIYPVGSVYLNVNNVNPSSFITGTTWELISSVGLASEHVFGNGYALGLHDGQAGDGLGVLSNGYATAFRNGYGSSSGGTSSGNYPNTKYLGVPTKVLADDHPEYSGLISDTITLYTWKRTA